MGVNIGKVFGGVAKLMPIIVQAVGIAERFKDLKGKDKEDIAVDLVRDLIPLVEASISRDLLDDEEVQAAVREMMRAAVATMNVVNAVKAKRLLNDPKAPDPRD